MTLIAFKVNDTYGNFGYFPPRTVFGKHTIYGSNFLQSKCRVFSWEIDELGFQSYETLGVRFLMEIKRKAIGTLLAFLTKFSITPLLLMHGFCQCNKLFRIRPSLTDNF